MASTRPRPTPTARRAPAATAGASRTPLWIVLGIVVLAAAVALGITAARGGNDDAAVPQTAAVTVTGEPLPARDAQAGQTGLDAAVGLTAPNLVGTSFDGSPVSVGAGAGAPALVMFVAHWCPHCQAEVPLLSEWIRAGNNPAGVDIVAVSTSVEEQAPNFPPSSWLEDEQWPTPVLVDDEAGSAARAYGLTEFPFFVLLDGDGTVVDRFTGEIPPADLGARVTAALAG